MKKHYNIPVFITHSGCKNSCVFCNQRIITGRPESAGEEGLRETIEHFIGYGRGFADTEIAFFGGSFTGLERARMIKLLEIANEYIESIRISTRPDYISHEIVDILLKYNVKSIELGAQSMSNDVLAACKRGHTAEDTERACGIIKSAGINLTGQMMLGLPRSGREKEIQTAKKLVDCGVDCARVYPAVVLPGTELCGMYRRGEYKPLGLDEAVGRAKEIKKIFDSHNINILRMGLCSSDISAADVIAGAYHPAFGELVEGELIYDALAEDLEKHPAAGQALVIRANKKNMSKIVGHKRKNINRLQKIFNIKIIEDNNITELYKTEISEK